MDIIIRTYITVVEPSLHFLTTNLCDFVVYLFDLCWPCGVDFVTLNALPHLPPPAIAEVSSYCLLSSTSLQHSLFEKFAPRHLNWLMTRHLTVHRLVGCTKTGSPSTERSVSSPSNQPMNCRPSFRTIVSLS
jgi:hypothetical protein